MKNLIVLVMASYLAMKVAAQTSGIAMVPTSTNTFFGETKITPSRINEIPLKAVRDFIRAHPNAENTYWQKVKDGSVVYFSQDGIETKCAYKPNGDPSYTLRFYKENDLPESIRKQFKSVYYDYTVCLVTEALVKEESIYLIKIEDKTSVKTVRISNGEMTVIENLRKPKE